MFSAFRKELRLKKKRFGGELYGTVNFDFTVHDKITFEMMVEQFRN